MTETERPEVLGFLDLSLRNVQQGYVDSITMVAQVLQRDGQWDWNLQRRLDADTKEILDMGDSDHEDFQEVADDDLAYWITQADHYGYNAFTDEGTFWIETRDV